jgi:AcrR family transcriptional regulator
MYPHYKTKESLLFAISVQGHESALLATTSADRPSDSPRDRLAATVAAYVIWHARNQSLAKVVQHELRSLSPDHFKYIASIRRRTSEVFARIIQLGNEQEAFHTIDAEAATLAITSLGVDVSRWFPSHAYSDPEVLAERYVELALRMVGAVN